MRSWSPRWIGPGLVTAWLVASSVASASPESGRARLLGVAERQQLSAGQRVERPIEFGRYVGGLSYQLVKTRPEQVLSALLSAENLEKMLPRMRSARLVSSEGGRSRIELRQGRSPFIAQYTVVLEVTEDGDEVRFWLDPGYAHDIADVWGFFRVTPFGSGGTLLSVGVAVDLGPGLARALFEERVQAMILSAVTGIRDFVEPRHVAAVDHAFLVD